MIQSFDRAMAIATALSSDEQRKWWTINDLSKECHLPVSTIYRLLYTLMKHGLVEQDAVGKQYALGVKWMEFGLRVLDRIDYRKVIKPMIEELAREVEESVYFSQPSGLESIIVDRIDSQHNIRVYDQLGLRIPLNIGAANKTILANMPTSEAEQILQQLIEQEQVRAFLEKLTEIKQQGYAVSFGERTENTASVAAPVLDYNQKVIGALSIGILTYDLKEERLQFLIQKVKEVALKTSQRLGSY
ncbi:IclR family transcriptional regulator [Brevibacillus reuszeri]|uniref:IclR family transcriptional regulator n=1 Tax=Brevibacillus reuszeri TaxID=54915 RepID=UPI001B255363|nr:IclR family transcriptional regulator [Brevibacillus reuszeri]GIO09475.1 IclR family transcriptional regulator [Brevibacillus reuszeri]